MTVLLNCTLFALGWTGAYFFYAYFLPPPWIAMPIVGSIIGSLTGIALLNARIVPSWVLVIVYSLTWTVVFGLFGILSSPLAFVASRILLRQYGIYVDWLSIILLSLLYVFGSLVIFGAPIL